MTRNTCRMDLFSKITKCGLNVVVSVSLLDISEQTFNLALGAINVSSWLTMDLMMILFSCQFFENDGF